MKPLIIFLILAVFLSTYAVAESFLYEDFENQTFSKWSIWTNETQFPINGTTSINITRNQSSATDWNAMGIGNPNANGETFNITLHPRWNAASDWVFWGISNIQQNAGFPANGLFLISGTTCGTSLCYYDGAPHDTGIDAGSCVGTSGLKCNATLQIEDTGGDTQFYVFINGVRAGPFPSRGVMAIADADFFGGGSQSDDDQLWFDDIEGSNKTVSIPSVTINFPDNNYHDFNNLSVNFTYTAITGEVANCSLIVDNETQKTALNIAAGTTTNLTSSNATNADYQWYISCLNVNGVTNSTTRTFVYDNINPIITWTRPQFIDSLSHNNISLYINITDLNLFRANLSVFNSSGSLFYNNYSANITGNTSWLYLDNLNFTQDGNYTIQIMAADSHTFGDFNGANYTFDVGGITFTKPFGDIRIEYGTYDGTFNKLVDKKRSDGRINTTVDIKQGEYSWNFNFDKRAIKENYAFSIPRTDKVFLINESIAHFVFMGEGFDGWYLDFADAVNDGFTPYIVENLTSYIVYFDSSQCKKAEGERCKI